MDVLRKRFEALKLKSVETFIASGNVFFESSATDDKILARKIESDLHQALGYEVRTFIRTIDELAQVAAHQPFTASDMTAPANAMYVAFVAEPVSAEAKRRLKQFVTAWDEFLVEGREIYWLTRRNMSDSKFSGAVLEKTIQVPATMRNITTVRKIAVKFATGNRD